MPCPRSPNLGRRSRANSLELPQSHLQVTSLSSSTNSYQSATVLTWVGALLKPSKDATCCNCVNVGRGTIEALKGRNMLAPAQIGNPTLPKPLADLSQHRSGPLPSFATHHSSLPSFNRYPIIRFACKPLKTKECDPC